MPWLPLLKLAKLVAVAFAVGGAAAVFVLDDPGSRKRVALRVAVPGLGVTWLVGFYLAYQEGVSFLSTWVLGGMAASFLSLHGTMFFAARPGRSRALWATFTLSLLFLTMALMVLRPD